jgi:hypothetical protein
LIFVPIGGCRPTVSLLNDFKTDWALVMNIHKTKL